MIQTGYRSRDCLSMDRAPYSIEKTVVVTIGSAVRYFQHAHFIPIVGVGKRGAYYLVQGDLPRQHPFGTTLRFTGPVLADSRQ